LFNFPAPISLKTLLTEANLLLNQDLSLLSGDTFGFSYTSEGDLDIPISSLGATNEAAPGTLTFAVEAKFLREAIEHEASAIITNPNLLKTPPDPSVNLILTQEPRLLFAAILGFTEKKLRPAWQAGEPVFFKDQASVTIADNVTIGPFTYIGANVTIGAGTKIGAQVFIEDDCVIGEDSVIHPGAILRWRVTLGDRVQIHSGAIIGEDGFGYTQVPTPACGRLIHFKNSHLGGVIIENDVEIGAGTTIDRGLVADTVIHKGSKLDNLAQIGHNVEIGKDCVIVSQVGAAGHAKIGDRAFILGQAGLSHGVEVGADAIITGQSGVTGNIPPGRKSWSNCPAMPHAEDLKLQAMQRLYLPKWRHFLDLFKKCVTFTELRDLFFAPPAEEKKTSEPPQKTP
jgi:UDP-3-O-[3-hydroxymyristoyl] glucosamine N-acyltransferase